MRNLKALFPLLLASVAFVPAAAPAAEATAAPASPTAETQAVTPEATDGARADGAAPTQAPDARDDGPAAAQPPEDAGALMERVFNRSGWKDMQGRITLTLKNARGDVRLRRIDLWSKKNAQGESRMLMRFVEPADVRGTAFLLIEHEGADDDRRLWMPALRRVQRISASGAGGSFMSSDFTYYDIGRPELSDWTYAADGEGKAGDLACRVVVGTAADEKTREETGYASIRWCVDTERLVVLTAEYTDAKKAPLKKLTAVEVQDVGGTPFATHMRMEDVSTGHVSEMVFSELEIDGGLDDGLFTERNLRRRR